MNTGAIRMVDVIGIDAPCMDFLVNLDRLPVPNSSTPFLESSWQGGGKVATALITLARLGDDCGIIANVGGDLYGDVVEWDFIRHNVDVSHLKRLAGHYTSLSLVLSDRETMGRSIIWQGGGAPLVTELDVEYLKQAKYLHVPGAGGVFAEAMGIVNKAGGKVVIDADRYDEAIINKLNMIDVFIASEFFFDKVSDDKDIEACCRKIQKKGPETVVFTFGEKGCAGLGADGAFFTEPAFNVPVVDTTGAGDVFHGAFIHGLLQGWDARECARWGNAVSAIKVTQLGGRAGIPDLATVQAFLSTGEIDSPELGGRVKWYSNALNNTINENGRRAHEI